MIKVTSSKAASGETSRKWKCTAAHTGWKQSQNGGLTDVVEADPVGGVHLLLDVPGDDEVGGAAQGELVGGGGEGGAAVGGDQVGVAVGPREAQRLGGAAALRRQALQVLRAQRVAHLRAPPPHHHQVLPRRGRHGDGGGVRRLGAGPGGQDGRGEGGANGGHPARQRAGQKNTVEVLGEGGKGGGGREDGGPDTRRDREKQKDF